MNGVLEEGNMVYRRSSWGSVVTSCGGIHRNEDSLTWMEINNFYRLGVKKMCGFLPCERRNAGVGRSFNVADTTSNRYCKVFTET